MLYYGKICTMKEVMILVGMQGSGKTHYCRTVLPDYSRVSQDEGLKNFAGVPPQMQSNFPGRPLHFHGRYLLGANLLSYIVGYFHQGACG